MSSYLTLRHSRSANTLSRHRPLPPMLTATPADSSRPVHAAAVNCTPRSVSDTPGRPRRNASSSLSTQKHPSSVLDRRRARTQRLSQSLLPPSSSHGRRALRWGWSASTSGRNCSGDRSDFFFEPLQLHLEPADLLEQLGLLGLGVATASLGPVAEQLVGASEQLLFPAVD